MSGPQNQWVFGYGSLMWNPGFEYVRSSPAALHGYHRRLSIYSHQYRGTPDKPGLVFGLDRGGSCRGIAFEVDGARWNETLSYLRDREQITNVYVELVKPVELADRTRVPALAFIVNRSHTQYTGHLADDKVLKLVQQGCGDIGTCREYVLNTAEHLRALGIRDRRLEVLAQHLRKADGAN
jgi:glutathione-specific gamma-glutamylcyclotransferase